MVKHTLSNEYHVPFDPALFKNREEEKQLFLDTISAKTQNGHLEFVGVAGQGKSELLKWIYYKTIEDGHAAAYVDFESAQYHRSEISPILETISQQLSHQFSPDPFLSFQEELPSYRQEFQKFYRDSLEHPQSADRRPLEHKEFALIHTFNDNLTTILDSSHKVIFCLDSTEKRYSPTFQAFEEQVLKYHTGHQNFMLVTAGQEKLVWNNTEINDKTKRCALKRLENEAVRKQLDSLAEKKGFEIEDKELVLDKLLTLTLGHPYSTYKLIDFWTDEFRRPLNRTVVEEHFSQSIYTLIETVIQDRILGMFQLSQEYPSVKDILRYLAPLRKIELTIFKYTLSEFLSYWFKEKKSMFFQALIGEFQKTYIFTEWRLGSGFELDPVVRNLLILDLRSHAPDRFLGVQEKLAKKYDSLVELTHEATQVKNIVERLYHYATYLRETQPNSVNALIKTELCRYLETYFTRQFTEDEDAVHEQHSRLSRVLEEDEELAELVDIPTLVRIIQEHDQQVY